LFRAVQTIEDHHVMQQDLDNLVKWSRKWQLGFDEAKFAIKHQSPPSMKPNAKASI